MKINKHIILLIFGFTIISCNEDFLELTPKSEANIADFFNTPEDFIVAVNGVYAELQSSSQYGGLFFNLIETRADNIINENPGGGAGELFRIDKFEDSSTNGLISEAWTSIYRGIYRSNLIISEIQSFEMDGSLKNQILGEAYFLRSLSYFNLVRLFGAVPLILSPQTPSEVRETARRNTVDEVYFSIIESLKLSVDLLPNIYSDVDLGRVTSAAAFALLGKVYLTNRQYSEAINVLRSVNGHNLLPNIADVFDVNNEMNSEIVFAIRYQSSVTTQDHGAWLRSQGASIISNNLLDQYNSSDTRLSLIQTQVIDDFDVPSKYADIPIGNSYSNDFPLMRYADVILMLAEALNENEYVPDGEAFDLLNQIRSRAGISKYSVIELGDQESFREAVIQERRLEFALENDRWFDLIRTGIAEEAILSAQPEVTSFENYKLVYPIPLSEIESFNDLSRFPQNSGY